MHVANVSKTHPCVGYGLWASLGGLGVSGGALATLLVASKILGKPSWRSLKTCLTVSGVGFVMGGPLGFVGYRLFRALVRGEAVDELPPGQSGDDALRSDFGSEGSLRNSESAHEPAPMDNVLVEMRAQQLDLEAIRICRQREIRLNNSCVTRAVREQKIDVLQELLHAGCWYEGTLHALVACPEMLRVILADAVHQFDVNALDRSGHTALWSATFLGNHEAVEILLEFGADPLKAGANSDSAFHYVAASDHKQPFLEAMLYEGRGRGDERIIAVDALNWQNKTALFIACENGYQRNVSLLVERGASPTLKQWNGMAALHIALEQPELLKTLLSRGCNDVDVEDNSHETPLGRAVTLGNTEAVQILLSHGADPLRLNGKGWTLLHQASGMSGSKEILRLILTKVPSNKIDTPSLGDTALQFACALPNVDNIELLLAKGANPNQIQRSGESSLHYAAQKGRPIAVLEKLLSSRRCRVDQVDHRQLTALCLAVWDDQTEKVRKLLQNGASPTHVPQRVRERANAEIQALLSKYG